MGSIKLPHASGNSMSIAAPAANPSADITLKVPSTTGSAGQVLKVASSNHSSTNAELEWAADSGGLFSSYAQVSHKENGGTNGGDLTNGAWRTRTLNTEDFDADGITSLSSNQFTLQAGTYFIEAYAAQYRTDFTAIRIYNATDSSVAFEGIGVANSSGQNLQAMNYVSGRVTISGAKAFEVQSRCQTTKASNGAGLADSNLGNTKETYVICKIYKEA